MELIDKAAVVAEIERRIKKYATIDVGNSSELDALYGAKCKALMEILSFLDTLEVKEDDRIMETLREFRGYLNGRLLYTFPLRWVDNIKVKNGVMVVYYFDEMQYNTKTGEEPLVEIQVDEIDIK